MAEDKIPEGDGFESKIVEIMSKHPNGLSHKILQDSIPSMSAPQLVERLNKLLAQHKVQLLQKGNQLVYKLKDSSSASKYQGSDIEEKVIFEAIERAGNNGVPNRDLKNQCHMALPQINKILKCLEAKKLIKCVTSSSRKKLFMLYDLEPSQTVTGGAFYSGEEFESEFVDVLGDQCYKYLVQAKAVAEKEHSDPLAQRNVSFKTAKDICDYINSLKISKVNLSLKDIEKILESLIYDDKIEKFISTSKTHTSKGSGTEALYRVSKPLINSGGFMMVPCGVCNIYRDCRIGGEISPATCVYMKQWLDF